MHLDLGRAVRGAVARVVDEAAEEAIRVLLHQLDRVRHVGADRVAAGQVGDAVGVDRVALRRLDERLVDPARLAAHGVRAVHHLQQALAGEGFAVVAPGQVDDLGRVAAGVDDHAGSRCAGTGSAARRHMAIRSASDRCWHRRVDR
jgi:hypothetical protein